MVASLPVILDKAAKKNIPVFGSEIEQVRIGCLAAMGLDYVDLGRQTGRMAAKILKGEAAFYGNSKAAETLGLSFPEELTASAKEMFTK